MKKASLIAAAFVALLAGLAAAAVEVVPFRIEETRGRTLLPSNVQYQSDKLTLILALNGPEAEAASKYGDLKLDEAVDDQGTSLIPAKDSYWEREAAKFKEFSNHYFRESDVEAKRPVAAPQVEIQLTPAKRTAAKITHLRGSLSIATQGTIKTIEVPALKPGDKKKLDIPADAGISITIYIKPGKDIREIGFEINGDENALESMDVLDATGNTVSTGQSSISRGGKLLDRSLDLPKPLDGTMKVVVKIAVDRKIVNVPFDIKDVMLP